MGKVGKWNTDPKAGAYCTIKLDGGEKILINHDKGGFKGGRLTIERLKLLGLNSGRIFECDLDGDQGKAALRFLTRDAQAQSVDATPLGAFVNYLKSCQSVGEVQARCTALMAIR